MKNYRKAVIASIGAAATALIGTVPDGSAPWYVATGVVAILSAWGVYQVPNRDGAAPDREAR